MEKNLKKERLFYLDFIRALAMIIIVTYHFSVGIFKNSNAQYLHFCRMGMWGLLGVALFLMISGASLMYNYEKEFDFKKYYKKRFLGIYPAYWIAYSFAFLYMFYKCKGLVWSGPIWRLIFSFLGIDGYLSCYTLTYGLVGNWFVGCIVLIYILFPLFRFLIKKFPKTLFSISTIIYLCVVLFSNFKMPLNQNLIVSLYAFILGMYYIEYVKNIKIWQVIIVSVIGFISLFAKEYYNMREAVFFVYFAAFNIFIFLVEIGKRINNGFIKNIIYCISKYSYVIFLVHHQVIQELQLHFSDVILDKYGTLIVYIMCWLIILVISKIVFLLNKKVLTFLEIKK